MKEDTRALIVRVLSQSIATVIIIGVFAGGYVAGSHRLSDSKSSEPKPKAVIQTLIGGIYQIQKAITEGHEYILYQRTIIHSESCPCKTLK